MAMPSPATSTAVLSRRVSTLDRRLFSRMERSLFYQVALAGPRFALEFANAVQKPGAAPKVRRVARQGKDLARNVRGVESRDRRQEAARACEAGANQKAEGKRQKAEVESGRSFRCAFCLLPTAFCLRACRSDRRT